MSQLQTLADQVDEERLWSHLTEFAKWQKYAGSHEELQSLDYVEKQLKNYGYATQLILHDAYISLPGKAALIIDDKRHTCITQSFAKATSATGCIGDVVDVGDGSAADFEAANVAGKIVLINGIATAPANIRATQANALGLIHISPHQHVHEMCISPVWGSPGLKNINALSKLATVTIPQSLGDQIRAELAKGPLEVKIEAEVDTGWRPTPILVAELAPVGAAGDEPYILFSGHHDTWHYGVMDNGGANATMLEVARLAATARGGWKRGLRLCFWSGHSQGRYSSSSWYADTHWDDIERRCAAHVNIDSTCAKGNTILTDAQASAELVPLAQDAVKQQDGQDLTGHRVTRAGDQSFWGIGVPSLFAALGEQPAHGAPPVAKFLFGGPGKQGAGTGWWWHTPEDTLDKMDREIAVRDTRVYFHAIWRLLSDPVLPLDYSRYTASMSSVLGNLATDLGGRFDLATATGLAGDLGAALTALPDAKGKPDTAQSRNTLLMGLSRLLVPLDYTSGDRFTPDTALGQSAFPVLDDLRTLAGTTPGSDAEKHAQVDARRCYNRFCSALRAAVSLCSAGSMDANTSPDAR